MPLKQEGEEDDNKQENSVEEVREEPSMSMLLAAIQSMQKEMTKEIKGVKDELKFVKDELKSMNGKLGEKESAAPKEINENDKLKSAVRLWCSDKDEALAQHGHISGWDISSITSMTLLFGLTDVERDQGNH